jgi:hypothetical protein
MVFSRRYGISNIEAANALMPSFIEAYNRLGNPT